MFCNGYCIVFFEKNITFEKNNEKYFYSVNKMLNQSYEVAQISLPNKISKSDVKKSKKKESKVKTYQAPSQDKYLNMLQRRLKKQY